MHDHRRIRPKTSPSANTTTIPNHVYWTWNTANTSDVSTIPSRGWSAPRSVISSPPGEQGNVTPEKANELTQTRKAAPAAILLDPKGQMGRAYDARTTPHMYLINAEGTLVYMGGIDSIPSTRADDLEKATPYFRDALAAVAKGEPVKNAVTRPYGCSVKYTTS